MNKLEFIQLHLIEKGVPADLTGPNLFIWSKHKDSTSMPLVFQSLTKVILVGGVFMGLVWGAMMWIMWWHSEPERWSNYLVSSVFFGIGMGLITAFRIYRARKRLGTDDWESWCERNY
ncbi:DUF6404 domain-containing protein [Vibrio mytili]|uniref:Uncharacterized protein n=2 Tax=Vibrio mytili TaxID=50718 RepID=A0A0C3DDA7_9VIBR|nr:DUF6404 family protein [Vibrio mytili]KIN09344.1 hypothetical protein SU60_20050 [Vibrio mytili]